MKFVRQNRFIVSLFVALKTGSIYVLCPFAARYFSALASSSGLRPRAKTDFTCQVAV